MCANTAVEIQGVLEKHWELLCPWAVPAQLRSREAQRKSSSAPSVIPADVYRQSSTAGKPSKHWNPQAKAPRDIWAVSRMVSDKSSLSFLQSVGLGLWMGPPFAQDQHQMCREISQKQDLKGFQHCTFL